LSHDCPQGVKRLETYLELTTKQFGISYKMDAASRANRKALLQVVERAQPKLLIHGHYHWAYTDLLHIGKWDAVKIAGLACDGMKDSFTIIDTEEICGT
jgi:hypothetical protein